MVNQEVLQGRWNELKGTIREKWGQLTKDDIQTFNGNVEQFIGLVERKTGETRDAINHFLEGLTTEAGSSLSGAVETAGNYAEVTANQVYDGAKQAGRSMRKGYQSVGRRVRQSPVESIAIGVGVGICAGVLLV